MTAAWNSRIVAVANNKGGVLKTSTTANVAGQLAAAKYRVLIVAFDAQRPSLPTDLGISDRADNGESLAQAVVTGGRVPPTIIRDVRPDLDVIADGTELERIVEHAYGVVGRGEGTFDSVVYQLLVPVLRPIAPQYDLVLVDCAPGTKVLTAAALGSARWLLIPAHSDRGSIQGIAGTADIFAEASQHNSDLELLGVVLTRSTTAATRVREAATRDIQQLFGGQAPVFRSFIRQAESPASASRRHGLLAHELVEQEETERAARPWWKLRRDPDAPKRAWTTNSSSLAEDYTSLTQEIVAAINERESVAS